jgi:hypothetical protein
MFAPAVGARKKQKKAGTIADNVYHDDKYGFDLTVHENWKVKINKDKNKARLLLTQRNFTIPSDYIDAPDYTHTPQLVLYVDTTTFGVHTFIDSLTSDNYSSKQKKEILKEFEFLNERDLIPKRRSRMEIAGESGVLWKAQAKYMKEVQRSASSASGKRVRREYGGAIAAVRLGENIVLFHLMTEWEYLEPVLVEVLPMIKSLAVPQEDES